MVATVARGASLLVLAIGASAHADVIVRSATPLITLEHIAMPSETRRTTFVLYDDGLVIYNTQKRYDEFGAGYAAVRLSDAETGALRDDVVESASFRALAASYDAYPPGTFDGLWQQLCVFGREKKCVGIRGSFYKADKYNNRANAPKAFLDAYDRVMPFSNARGKLWLPSEIRLRAYPEKRGAPKPWPSKWARPLTPEPPRGPGDVETFNFTLPGTELRAVQVFLDDHKPVMIDGNRYYVSVRFQLPGQAGWAAK